MRVGINVFKCVVFLKINSFVLTMRHLVYLLGFLLLCIQQGCMGVPVDTDKGVQYIYSYLGYIDTRSSACDERLARWSIRGDLTAQRFDNYWIFQLNNLKTRLFNGPKADFNLSHEEVIPKEAEVLKLPFIYENDMDIIVNPDDRLWSVNLKRGIVTNFHKLKGGTHSEKSVFGECETIYEMICRYNNTFRECETNCELINNKTIVVKTINHESCKDTPDKHQSNVREAPAPDDFKLVHRETVTEIKPDFQHENVLSSIHTVSRLSYQPMPRSPNSQHIDQYLELDLVTFSSEFDRINTDKITKKQSVIFQNEEDQRHVYDNAKGLTQEFFTFYENFEKYLEATPIENRKNATDEPMQHMFYSLVEMPEVNDLKNLHEQIENKANWEMYSTFMSLLAYAGTNNSVKYINDIVLNGDFIGTPITGLRLLATFPYYINNPNEELIQSLEGLLNVENVTSQALKNAQILSFASVVGKAFQKDKINEEQLMKYAKMYHDKYLGSEDYEDKMIYLLGLINMAVGIPRDFILDIIKDKSQSGNLRSLAIAGFKERLFRSNPIKLFSDTFWPMVKDKEENFDVRVQALDWVMNSGIPPEIFNIIVAEFTKYQAGDIYGKHLANYFRTTLESMQNNTQFWTQNSKLATEILQNKHFPIFSRPWTTGNYHLTYSDTDPNIGGYFQVQLIANPVLNTISTAKISVGNFAFSFDTREYTVYLKLQGGSEYFYKDDFFKKLSKDTTIPELLKLIKDFDFKMKKREQKFHIEIVIFVGNTVVYAMNLNNENEETYQKKLKNLDYVAREIFENTFILSFPISDHRSIPSVLGTPLNIKNDMEEVINFGYPKKNLKFRSSSIFQTSLESYNPIVDTTITSYKYYGDEIGLRTSASINLRSLSAVWEVKQNSFNRVWDNLIGTSVQHEPILKRYCSDCDTMHEIPTNLNTHNRMKEFPTWGMGLNYTIETNSENKESEVDKFKEFIPTHQSYAYAFPYAKPLLVLLHLNKFKNYFKTELQRGSYRSVPIHEDGVQTFVKWDWENRVFTYTVDPFADTHNNFTIYVTNRKLEDEANLSDWEAVLEFKSTHNYKDEHGKEKVKMTQNFYFHEHETNETGASLCVSRVELLPPVRSDKFSLLPTEETTATTIIRQDPSPAKHTNLMCSDNSTVTLTESYIVTEEMKKKVKESEDFKECQKMSKGLKYVPSIKPCIASFIAGSQYSEYKVDAEIKNVIDMDGTGLDKNYLFKSYRVDDNKIKFELLSTPFGKLDPEIGVDLNHYFKYTMYFPYQTKNPAADVYRDNDIVSGFKRSCIVTPKKIRSFTGRNIPINETKQVAFVECFENALRGMTIEKLSDTHIGFRFWSTNYVIDTSVHEDKIKIALNGNDLHESYLPKDEKIWVRFLDKNVVLIADEKISVYYNTEYIYIKADPMYNDLICGVCSQV